jgi:hypothetical protein
MPNYEAMEQARQPMNDCWHSTRRGHCNSCSIEKLSSCSKHGGVSWRQRCEIERFILRSLRTSVNIVRCSQRWRCSLNSRTTKARLRCRPASRRVVQLS